MKIFSFFNVAWVQTNHNLTAHMGVNEMYFLELDFENNFGNCKKNKISLHHAYDSLATAPFFQKKKKIFRNCLSHGSLNWLWVANKIWPSECVAYVNETFNWRAIVFAGRRQPNAICISSSSYFSLVSFHFIFKHSTIISCGE